MSYTSHLLLSLQVESVYPVLLGRRWLITSGGGLAEMADRILRTSHKFDDKQASMTKVLTDIALRKSLQMLLRRRYSYLRDTDTIIFQYSTTCRSCAQTCENMKQKQTTLRILDINISL